MPRLLMKTLNLSIGPASFQLTQTDINRIMPIEGMYLRPGDVCLVRSENVPGDHFIIVTGPPEQKDHGLRPQTITIPITGDFLDEYKSVHGVVLLKLNTEKSKEFLKVQGYRLVDGKVLFNSKTVTNA